MLPVMLKLCNFAAKVLLFFDICKRKGHFLQFIGFRLPSREKVRITFCTMMWSNVKCTIIKIDMIR